MSAFSLALTTTHFQCLTRRELVTAPCPKKEEGKGQCGDTCVRLCASVRPAERTAPFFHCVRIFYRECNGHKIRWTTSLLGRGVLKVSGISVIDTRIAARVKKQAKDISDLKTQRFKYVETKY